MRRVLFLIAIFCSLAADAQNYFISFSGTGESTTVSTVKVENLTAGTSLTLNGDDILGLTLTVSISDIKNDESSRMMIYPNPMTDEAFLQISAPLPGDAIISVFEITGKLVSQTKSYLGNNGHKFIISGLKNGLYLVNVRGNTYQYSEQLISNGKSFGAPVIRKVTDNIQGMDLKKSQVDSKGIQSTVDMEYTTGDIIKFTGVSGDYSTVVTSVPDADATITFDFVTCTDGDGNNYPVVKIGTQTWMAQSLKTTKYRDGSEILLVSDNTTWLNLSDPAYCWYDNASANKDIYGALYNGYAVSMVNLCPTGWHVPSNTEWTDFATALGSSAGGKLKETGITHWANPNFGATNESGFTALPAGYRDIGGGFMFITTDCYFWSTSELPPVELWSRSLVNYDVSLFMTPMHINRGLSVRCLKD
jgi:uncharacterized protein (TIGR02145 family)